MARPDISLDVASIAGATNARKVADMKRVAKVIKRAKRSKVVLRLPKMEVGLRLIVYCDADWGNLDSGTTGGGIFLALATTNPQGGNEQFCPVNWHAKRLRRVVRSTFAGETLIASEAMDEVIYTAEIWSELGNGMVRTTLRTRCCSLYNDVHLKGSCKEKGLRVDLPARNEAIFDGQLSYQECVETEKKLADWLSHHMKAFLMLKTINSRVLA